MKRSEASRLLDKYLGELHSVTWHLHDIGRQDLKEEAMCKFLDELEVIGIIEADKSTIVLNSQESGSYVWGTNGFTS